ncbi:MAG: glycosyltransferase, partial [Gemmatimonadota bacterium]|nr:glycosyltransferase [Gemmatimonadota bacterium]
ARERIRTVYNGVDSSSFSPVAAGDGSSSSPQDAPYILYMGRIKRYKRLELILEGFSHARQEGLSRGIRLVIAGAGDDSPRLEARAVKLGISDITSFPGRVSEKEKVRLMQHALAVVNPSPKEGWGITNIEAQACGTPVIASRSPGLRESVRDGVTGFLFAPGDVEDLAARILQVAHDETLRDKLGRAAREFAMGFTWDEAAESTLRYIEDILEKKI